MVVRLGQARSRINARSLWRATGEASIGVAANAPTTLGALVALSGALLSVFDAATESTTDRSTIDVTALFRTTLDIRIDRWTRFSIRKADRRRTAHRLGINDATLTAATLNVRINRGTTLPVRQTNGPRAADQPGFTDAAGATTA
jgi:hypothetical protein